MEKNKIIEELHTNTVDSNIFPEEIKNALDSGLIQPISLVDNILEFSFAFSTAWTGVTIPDHIEHSDGTEEILPKYIFGDNKSDNTLVIYGVGSVNIKDSSIITAYIEYVLFDNSDEHLGILYRQEDRIDIRDNIKFYDIFDDDTFESFFVYNPDNRKTLYSYISNDKESFDYNSHQYEVSKGFEDCIIYLTSDESCSFHYISNIMQDASIERTLYSKVHNVTMLSNAIRSVGSEIKSFGNVYKESNEKLAEHFDFGFSKLAYATQHPFAPHHNCYEYTSVI